MLLFGKTLRELQSLISGKAIAFIHVLLQRGKIEELRRIGLLVLLCDRLYHQLVASHLLKNLRSLGLIFEFTSGVFKQCLATHGVHLPEILWLKKLHVQVAIHNHR